MKTQVHKMSLIKIQIFESIQDRIMHLNSRGLLVVLLFFLIDRNKNKYLVTYKL